MTMRATTPLHRRGAPRRPLRSAGPAGAALVALSLALVTGAPVHAGASRTSAVREDTRVAATGGTLRRAHVSTRAHLTVRSLPRSRSIDTAPTPRLGRPASPSSSSSRTASGLAAVTAAAAASTVATRTGGSPTVVTAFDGLTEASQATDLEPPDPWIAVGPEHVVQAVNQTMRVTDRAGTLLVDTSLSAFFGLDEVGLPPWDGDPRVIFDSVHGRWLASEYAYDCAPGSDASYGHGYVDLAVSDTADPTGGWTVYTYPYADAFPDYPSLGTSTDKIGEGVTLFGMKAPSTPGGDDCIDENAFGGRDVVVYDWAPLIANTSFYVAVDSDPNGFAPRVALQTPATSSTLFVVEEYVGSTTLGHVGYTALTGRAATTVTRSAKVDLTATAVVPGFAPPPQPHQPGGTIAAALDERPTDAVWQNGRLAFVSTSTCTPAGDSTTRDCVRVTDLTTPGTASSAPTRRQDMLVGDNGFDSYMGGIGVSADRTLHVVWTRSSGSANPAIATGFQTASAAVNTLTATTVLKSSTAAYVGQRWGDYVGVAQDPQVPDAVWQAHEYPAADGTWATYATELQTTGLRYVPITPARLVDTRSALGISSSLTMGTPRTFAVTGKAGIPASAKAITGNVTVVNQTAAGFVAITPTAVAAPSTSTINFPLGDIRANNVTATLGPTGTLSAVYRGAPSGRTTDLVFDVTGYYVDDASKAGLTPVTPSRFLDSRIKLGSTGSFAGNTPRFVQLTGRTIGAVTIPTTAVAITGNLTVTNQTRGGYLSVMPTSPGTSVPPTSTLNFPVKDNRANGVTVPLGTSGSNKGVWIVYRPGGGTSADHADVILDVTGYFTNAAGLRFHPLNPGRIMDTRLGAIFSGYAGKIYSADPVSLQATGHWGVPAGATAITGNLTVTNQTNSGYVSATKDKPAGVPPTSTINFPKGDNRANGVTAPLGSTGALWFDYESPISGSSTDLILDLSGYFK